MNTRPSFSLLSVVSNIARHKIASDEPFVLLLDLAWPPNVAASLQTHVRFARFLEEVWFDANDGNGPQEYAPFNFMLGEVKATSDGSVPDTEVQVSNVMLALQQYIEQYAGVVGASLDLYVVNTANLAGEPELALSFTVKSTTSDNKLVHFKCGASSPLRRLFPIYMYRPNSCCWQYNSPALQQATAAAIAAGKPLADPPGIQCGYAGIQITATFAAGVLTIPTSSATSAIAAGMVVWGPGIASGATVASTASGSITLAAGFASTSAETSVTLTCSLPTCSQTIDGPNGCEAHNNLIRILTFPGIDTNGAAVASVA